MSRNDVKTLYGIGSAKWYDPFKRLWNKLTATGAEKELSDFLRNNLDETKTILELGCGTALNLEKIFSLDLKFKRYLGLDFSQAMLEIASTKFENVPNVEFRQKDITKLNDMTNKYDIIICTWVLSHLQYPSDFVNQAQELMKKGSNVFLIFFTRPKWFINFWLFPLSRFLFRTNYVLNEEIQKIKSVKSISHFSSNIVTVIEIYD